MPRTRVVASVVAVGGLLLTLGSAAPAIVGAAAHPLTTAHPSLLARAVHPSLRVVSVRVRKIVRVHGIVRSARVVPTQRQSAITLTADAAGVKEFMVPTPDSQPEGVVVLSGKAWFAEAAGDKIGKVTTAGAFTEYPVPAEQYNSGDLHSITVGADQNLWFTTYSYIGRMTTSGTFSLFPITPDSYAYDITLGPDGNVWFTEVLGRVGYVTPAGAVTEFAVGSGINPEYITAGPDGALWFTAKGPSGQNYVYQITTAGSLTQYVLPSTWILGDITTGPDGRLWFDSHTNSLTALTPGGTYTTYHWKLKSPNGYSPQYLRTDGTALVFACLDNGSIGQMTTNGTVSFTPIPSGNGATGLGVGSGGNIWFSEVNGNAMGLLPAGPNQFPPGVPTTQDTG